MAEQTTPLAALHDEFDRARGIAMDGVWAHAVAWRLMRRDVDPEQVREGLAEALALVRETQESPEDLFGTPDEHADALYDRWSDEGRLHLWDASRVTWREVPSSGLAGSAFVAVAFMLVFYLRGEGSRTWTLGMVLLPIGIGLARAIAAARWDSLLRSRGLAAAVAGTVAVLVAIATTLALLTEWSKTYPFGTASVGWYVPVAAACGLLAITWRRWVESRPAPLPAGVADVDAWSRELAAILRTHHRLADVRVRTIVGDAHAHAADAGRTVQEEFGTPEEYAATFRPDLARGRLLATRLHGAVAVLWLVPSIWGISWTSVAGSACWGLLALHEYRRYRALIDEPTP